MLSLSFIAACSVNEQQNSQQLASITPEEDPEGEVYVDMLPKINIHSVEPEERPEQRELTRFERFSGVLKSHNKIRAKHNVPPLTWSKKLADYSMKWAKHLSRGNKCDMYHRTGNTPFGENLYRSTAIVWTDGKREVNPVTIKDVVKAWTDEEKWYNYKTNSCQPGALCGHYTQAVWKTTTEVGCAMQVCDDKSQTWVCSYNPPGNFTGVRPY